MPRLVSNRVVIAGIMFSALLSPVYADDLEVTAIIDRVTVFRSGAEVTRTGTVSIPAGEHRLIITDLPPRIDPARLQMAVSNGEIRLGNLQLEELHEGDLVSVEEQSLQRELETLLFDRQGIVDETESANTQLKFLDSLASGAVGGQQTSLQGSELAALLTTLATSSIEARLVIRNANQQLQRIDREIEQKRFELNQVATRQHSRQVVTASVEASSAVSTEVSITYPVSRARWTWLYEARLDTETRNLELERKVSVTQTTGEDWVDVELNITTARPNQNTQTPQLGSLLVDIFRPQPLRERRDVAARAPSGLSVDAGFEEIAVSDSFVSNFSEVSASQYLVDFKIPGRVSIDADSQPQILPIDRRGIEVDLVTRVVPELDTAAYLEARFTHEDTVPLQAGIMQLYRDGAFMGRRMVAEFLPMEEVSLPFGQDDRVRIETRAEQEQSRDGGTFRRSAVDDHRVRYELTSFHSQPIELEILARIPVSQNEAIEVEVGDEATPFDEENVDGKTGVVLWRRQAKPAETLEIKHYYNVRYPRDDRLKYQNN
ncbi:MAG: mucoidy inhibitor MuiA family protein [Gammaproteobacteria bacterium]|nr:mucoidy inhibitor MuiA family protein [Gammaproteobacteria bacterium]